MENSPNRSLKNYFFQFILVFAAALCALFVHTYWQNQQQEGREKQAMVDFLEALKSDTAMLGYNAVFCEQLGQGMDSLKSLLDDAGQLRQNATAIYRLQFTNARLLAIEFNTPETCPAVSDPEVDVALAAYYKGVRKLQNSYDSYKTAMFQSGDLSYALFDRKYLLDTKIDRSNGQTLVRIDPAAELMTTDRNTIINYSNRIASLQTRLSKTLLKNIKQQNSGTVYLIKLIKQEYGIK